MPLPKLYRVDEAALALALQPSTVRRMILDGKISVVRPSQSRAVRITEDELARLLQPSGAA
jgi:excisionase family DNA binding protein